MINSGGEDGEVPPEGHLDYLMEALRSAEELGWHHCPPGTLEGDHYDRIVERLRREYAWEQGDGN